MNFKDNDNYSQIKIEYGFSIIIIIRFDLAKIK
jgi:hypothetical protein